MIKALGYWGGVTLIVLGVLIVSEVVINELKESIGVCCAKNITIGAK